MAKKTTSTKTIIIVSASVLIAGGLGFLIWKLVKNNKKKKEEEKRKKEEEEALKQMGAFFKPITDGFNPPPSNTTQNQTTLKPAPSIKISAPSSTNPITSKNITLENKVMGSTPSFKPKPSTKEFNVYKPLMK